LSKPWNKLIVALDITSEKKIREVIKKLSPKGVRFKIGLIAYTRFGPKAVKWVTTKRAKVFLDFKLYDIPNTMAECAKQFVVLGVWAFTVHIRAGKDAIQHVKKEITRESRRLKKKRPLVIGVTELTSRKAGLAEVLQLAKLAKESGADGVVCSVWEAKRIKQRYKLLTITPGIRKKVSGDDQKRIASVQEALRNKSDYFVVGRPIVKSGDCLEAARQLLEA
jgi:orotidine-5'-phosphate decarboxylase